MVVAVLVPKEELGTLQQIAGFPAGLAGMNLSYTPSGFHGDVTAVPTGTGSCQQRQAQAPWCPVFG